MTQEYICKKCGKTKDIISWRKDGHKEVRCRDCRNKYYKNYQRAWKKFNRHKKTIPRIIKRLEEMKEYNTRKYEIVKIEDGYKLYHLATGNKVTITKQQFILFMLKEIEDYVRNRANSRINRKDERSSKGRPAN